MQIGPFNAQDTVAITTLGLEFATAVALGTAGGFYADKHWHTTPWGILAGVLAGFALGMYIVLKEARRMANQDQQKGS